MSQSTVRARSDVRAPRRSRVTNQSTLTKRWYPVQTRFRLPAHIVPVGVTSKRDRHVYSLSIMRRTRFLSIVADLLCRSPNMFCIRHRRIYQQLKNARRIRHAVLFGTIYCVKTILALNVSWYGSNTFLNDPTLSIDTLLNSQKWSFENGRTSTRRLTADEKKSCR